MFFVDFNGNGKIDSADIALSLAISEEEETSRKEDDDDIQRDNN